MFFKATMEKKIKLITYLVGYGVGLGIPAVMFWSFLANGRYAQGVIPAGIMIIVLFIAYLYRPLGYEVDARGIAVIRPIGKKFFARSTITAVNGTTDLLSQPCIGLWRSGGFYGVYGIFWTKRYGRFLMYVTNCGNLVEVVLASGVRVYLSPDDKQSFLGAVSNSFV